MGLFLYLPDEVANTFEAVEFGFSVAGTDLDGDGLPDLAIATLTEAKHSSYSPR